jgi:hypothetical protein
MKKISVAFLAAMSLAAFGCRKSKGGEDLAKLTELKNTMCACKDKACSEKVSDEYSMWSQTQAKSDGDKPGTPGEEDKKMEELIEELTQCLLKREVSSGGGAAGSAGATGSAGAAGAAGSAGAAGAAGSAGGTTDSGNPAAGSANGAAGSAAAGSAH